MNCEQANKLDMVDYLFSLGFSPAKNTRENYFYLSPLRQEKTPSFKVNRTKNIWYDHGEGKGGTLVDFASLYFKCGLNEALQKISERNGPLISPFHPQYSPGLLREPDERAINILSVQSPVTDMALSRYLKQRNIPRLVANDFCNEIRYQSGGKRYSAIGFKNNAGGYELRSEHFKGSSSPKYVTYFDNKANNISCFEGFFDFLSYQAFWRNHGVHKSNFLILNSLSFFTRSLLLMEKHERVYLYLDNDTAGNRCLEQALERSVKISDESSLYRGYQDLNEWWVDQGKQQKQEHRHGLRP